MKFPTLRGLIDRRILVNFAADPEQVARILPAPFRPRLYQDKAIVGICLIRLKHIRPKGFPRFTGISSENGAHRIAVEWKEQGTTQNGVYIPRRDTSLRLNAWVGGRLFPGKHYLAAFDVNETGSSYHVAFNSSDGARIAIQAKETTTFDPGSVFGTLENASAFFEQGAVGYSPNGSKFDGMCLHIDRWQVKPLEVSSVHSSFFENEAFFPGGSVQFDNALLMTQVNSEWRSIASK
jgi:hypothetical protein